MTIATGICPIGGHPFEYEIKRGKSKTYCSPEHAFQASAKRQLLRNAQLAERRCARCGEVKLSEEFAGLSSVYCKPCMATWARERRARGIKTDPAYTRKVNLARYGMTPEGFAEKLASQGGRCAICRTLTPGGQGWHQDHDHSCCNTRKKSCGKCLRGILCTRCNIGIGNLKEDPVIIQAALDYVIFHRERIDGLLV